MRLLLAILLLLIAAPASAQQSQGMSQALVVSSCGGGSLPSGALNQLTMDTTGRLCQIGVGSSFCPQATTYLARTVGGNEGGNAANIVSLICGLVADGVWNKLDVFYVTAQQNQTDANLNLVSTSYNLPMTTTAWTAYQGYYNFWVTGGGINTGFDPSLGSPHMQTNNGSLLVWMINNPGDGEQVGGGALILGVNFFGQFFCGVGVGGSPAIATYGGTGLVGCEQNSSAGTDFYANATHIGFFAGAGSAFPGGTVFFGGGPGGTQPTSTLMSELVISASLGAAGQAALYNRLATYMAAIAPPCPEATAYLARATGETTHAADLTTLICGLVTDGVWSKLDALYVLAQQNQADAQLNLIGTSYGLTSVGLLRSVTFTSYVGFNGFGSAVFLSTGFNAAIAVSPKFVQNSASYGVWVYNVPVPGVFDIGNSSSDAGLSNMITDYNVDGLFYMRLNASGTPGVTGPGVRGLYVGDRSSSANIVPYVNGVAQTAQASTSVSPTSAPFTVGQAGSAQSANTLSATFIGGSLGASGQLALYNRLRTYMTAVGVP